jgi:hypothetical protein
VWVFPIGNFILQKWSLHHKIRSEKLQLELHVSVVILVGLDNFEGFLMPVALAELSLLLSQTF